MIRVRFLSIVPSPYQRDLFGALAQRQGLDLRVDYLEASSPDSPWPERPAQPYERVLRGSYFSYGGARFHLVRPPKDLKDADIIVLNGYMNNAAQRLLRTPARSRPALLFWGERIQPARRSGWRGLLHSRLTGPLRSCSGIAAVGGSAAQDYSNRYPGTPVWNVPYFCNLEIFRTPPPERPHRPPVVLFCGQMIRRKGVDLLLRAFVGLRSKGIACRLLLVGRKAQLPEMLAEVPSGILMDIKYAGFQAPESLPAYFARADLFVLPSRYDGWGVVVNQALGAGLPVITSSAVGASELIREKVNGRIFPSGDAAALESALEETLEDANAMHRMGQTARDMARQLEPEEGARRWMAIFEDVQRASG